MVTGYAAKRVSEAVGRKDRVDATIHPSLREHVKYFEKHVAELARTTEAMVLRHREKIIDRQLVLERLAEMAIELYATACVIARTQALIAERGVDETQRERTLCDLFCVESGRRFRSSRSALDAGEEEVDDRRREVAAAARETDGYFVRPSL